MPSAFVARVRRLGAVISLVVLVSVFLPATARAGGPTSALLVSPANQQAAALYTSDPEYEQLMMLLDEPATGTSTNPAGTNPAPSVAADYVTVTWLIHDVTVWRIDRIFLAGPAGEPSIVTQTDNGDAATPLGSGMFPGDQGNDSALWHRSSDPAALINLLTNLGLLNTGQNSAVRDSSSTPVAVQAAVDPPVRATGVWWAIGGVLIGAALMVSVMRYLPAARRRLLGDDIGQGPPDQPRRMVEIPG